MYWYIH